MKEKLDYIDSIRGVAILMVILVHTAQSVKTESILLCNIAAYGQMGVQLFFVASAFTLCHSWQTRKEEINRSINFAIRRFFRIAPMYYLGISLYFIVAISENFFHYGTVQNTSDYTFINVIANVLFLHGFYPPANNTIVPGGWSIGTEMAFYALFPLLMGLLSRNPLRSKSRIISLPIFGIILSQIILFMLYQLTGEFVQKNNFLYFNIANQLPVFLIGVSLYLYGLSNILTSSPKFTPFLLFLGITFFNLILWKTSVNYGFTIIPFLSGISFVFLIKTFEVSQKINFRFLRKIGQVSYSMYLFHFIFAHKTAQFVNNRFSIEDIVGGDFTLILLFFLSVLFTFGMAILSEKLIEKRFILLGRDIIHRHNNFCTAKRSTGLV